jgi:hypothetical protein
VFCLERKSTLMHTRTHGENLLYELARTLAAGNDHSTAIALRKLVQAGYTTLQQVDVVPDYILLSIPGMGVKRLRAVRRLIRPDWQPPSRHAVQISKWYLSAVRFALCFWPPDTLASVVRGSGPAIEATQPLEARLALDVFTRAASEALRYSDAQELLQPLQEARNGHSRDNWLVAVPPGDVDVQPEVGSRGQGLPSSSNVDPPPYRENGCPEESDHYAYPRQRRLEIVRRYRKARNQGEVKNKEAWAQANYGISVRTLRRYELEYPETG